MLFDGLHLSYIIISLLVSAGLLFLAKKYIHTEKYKEWFLKFWAIVTVFLHLITLYDDYLKTGSANVADNQLFPIYFCNMTMYLLVITALWGNKKTKFFQYLATVTSFSGILGSLISLFYPEYYLNTGDMFVLHVFKSLLSHSTMLIGCLYLIVGRYIKISFKESTITFGVGLLGFGLVGVIVNAIFKWAHLPPPNAMYLQRPPIPEVPFLNVYVIALMLMGVVALSTYIYSLNEKKHASKRDALYQSS